jgi:hypothetical protein
LLPPSKYSVPHYLPLPLHSPFLYPLPLLGNGSVNTFPRQRGIVRGVVFYAVRVVSKESRRLVFPRTSFFPPCFILATFRWYPYCEQVNRTYLEKEFIMQKPHTCSINTYKF